MAGNVPHPNYFGVRIIAGDPPLIVSKWEIDSFADNEANDEIGLHVGCLTGCYKIFVRNYVSSQWWPLNHILVEILVAQAVKET